MIYKDTTLDILSDDNGKNKGSIKNIEEVLKDIENEDKKRKSHKDNKQSKNEDEHKALFQDNDKKSKEKYTELYPESDKKESKITFTNTNDKELNNVPAKVKSNYSRVTEFSVAVNVKERLSDVKGMTEIKEEIAEVVKMLKEPNEYEDAGAKLVRGILLMGKPGTGKTLLARALAGEAGVNFIYCNGADFDKMYVGQGSKSVKNLFKQARDNQPCIIFIDEVDSLLHKGRRSGLYSSSNDRSLINTFLTEMDGFKQREYVFVMGATNSEKDLDKAAIRPGRFDKLITVPLPDSKGRTEIFEYYLKKVS